ncbi:hypothetical protein ACIQM4_29465 [Streptomyces sp. NPDC091272]|uniref:hypothetical protein n=1 Tax=Streptomyces sp. NPDC091272 TaxID=3365981 RepID=UPI0037F77142
MAGGIALRAPHRVGPPLGRRVLITGATGCTGHFAVQPAGQGGAHVIASTGSPVAFGDIYIYIYIGTDIARGVGICIGVNRP